MAPPLIIVMGVSGTGKSTLSAALGNALCVPVLDADDLHPPANVEKMSRGIPLIDEDRWPWLDIIRCAAEEAVAGSTRPDNTSRGVVVACSALRTIYRDVLRQPSEANKHQIQLDTFFVYIHGTREVLFDRMSRRQGHFMKASMLDSQLSTLENPTGETGVVTVDLESTTEEQVATALRGLEQFGVDLDVNRTGSIERN